MTNEI